MGVYEIMAGPIDSGAVHSEQDFTMYNSNAARFLCYTIGISFVFSSYLLQIAVK